MKKSRLLQIMTACERQTETSDGPDCTKCPLVRNILLTINTEEAGAAALIEARLRLNACQLLSEVASRISEPSSPKKAKDG